MMIDDAFFPFLTWFPNSGDLFDSDVSLAGSLELRVGGGGEGPL